MSTKKVINLCKAIAFPAVAMLLIKLFYPNNITWNTVSSMIYQAVVPSILAWGVCFNIKVGNSDFSVGANAMLSAIIGGYIADIFGLGPILCFLLVVACSFLLGILTALAYKFLQIPTIIVTLCVVYFYESVTTIFNNGQGVMLDSDMQVLAAMGPTMFVLVLVFPIAYYLYNVRAIGYHVRAVGNGTNIAAQTGIDPVKIKMIAFIIAGTFSGIYGACTLLSTGVYRAATAPMASMAITFDAMMSVYIGMSFAAWTNLTIGIYIGAVCVRILKLFMTIIGLSTYWNNIVVAAIVLVFLVVSSVSEMKKSVAFSKVRGTAQAK